MTDRKARLAALAAKAGRQRQQEDGEINITESTIATETRRVQFRNYTPADKSLESNLDDDEPVPKKQRQEKSALEEALEKAQLEAETPQQHTKDVTVLAPKKINWDLKRDIQPKLDKLERRTERAIVQLLKERLQNEAEVAADDLD